RLKSETGPYGTVLTYSYDAVGNRTLTQDSFGATTTSVYDAANELTSKQQGGAGQTQLRVDLAYTPRGQVGTLTRYSDVAGTTKVGDSLSGYDSSGRLTSLQHRDGGGATLEDYGYGYDNADRLTSATENGSTTTYGYDATNELTSAGTYSYSYDL